MNTTPRWLNRIVLGVLGALLILCGATMTLIATVPDVRDGWTRASGDVVRSADGLAESSLIGGTHRSWMWIVILLVLVLLIALAVLVVARQGRGRTGRLLEREGPPEAVSGSVTITTAVAEHLIAEAVSGNPDMLSVHVSAHRLKRQTALRITVAARKGASPATIASTIHNAVIAWDEVFGAELPVVIDIVAGIRARASHPLSAR